MIYFIDVISFKLVGASLRGFIHVFHWALPRCCTVGSVLAPFEVDFTQFVTITFGGGMSCTPTLTILTCSSRAGCRLGWCGRRGGGTTTASPTTYASVGTSASPVGPLGPDCRHFWLDWAVDSCNCSRFDRVGGLVRVKNLVRLLENLFVGVFVKIHLSDMVSYD